VAIVTINREQFEKEIGTFDSKMQEKISMFGTPIETSDSNEIHIEIFPNRPDLLSYHGFKRSFLAFLGKKTGLQNYKINKPEENYKVIVDSSVKDIRPHTACAIIKGLRLDDKEIKEIIEMQEKLHLTIGRKRKKVAIGIYPLEKIKLPITFKAIEPDQIKFIPLEIDRELSGLEILQKHPTGKEYSHLLAGKTKFPIFVDSTNQILSMPPIINSQSTGRIDSETRDVFIECSGFDLDVLKTCLNIIVVNMADMGGKIYQMDIHYGYMKKEKTPSLDSKKMKISLENANKLLGLDIKEKDMKQLLEKMGHNYKSKIVEIPAWRTDILHEVDLIEDIAIAYGYDKFVPEIPEIATVGSEYPKETIKRKFSEILSGLGIIEVSNYHLTNKIDQIEKMGLSEKTEFTKVINSKTDYNILRQNLSHFLLKNLSENVDAEYPQKISEIGKVFNDEGGKIKEIESLSIAISPGSFTEIKQIIEYFFKMLELKITFSEPKEKLPWFIEGRTAEIIFNGKTLGFLGEIHPKILKNWKVKMPVALLEINIEDVLRELG
jgi:phenylalanyl-tRNA synthetase beta chain